MRDTELNSIGDCLIAFGFTASNDPGHKFRFIMDDIFIIHRGFMWVIADPEHGPAEYQTLRELIENESIRWEE